MKVLQAPHLAAKLNELFPSSNIITNVRKPAHIISPESGYPLELDFWIPEAKLAFEFQDPHHYNSTGYASEPVAFVRHRDNFKVDEINRAGQTLITIPCWWDGTTERLVATIQQKRPDLLPHLTVSEPPIEPTPPLGYFTGGFIPDVEQMMLCSSTIPQDYVATDWWVSEKYDGVRVCWHAGLKKLYSRNAVAVLVPDQFTRSMEDTFLDGELWFGREGFNNVRNTINGNNSASLSAGWELLRLVCLDIPYTTGESLPFESRYQSLLALDIHSPFMIALPVFCSLGSRHVIGTFESVTRESGEGIVLRRRNSLYERGRSTSMVKLKASREQDGLVVKVEPPTIQVQMPDGTTQWIAMQTERYPNAGVIVSIANSSKGEIAFRERHDLDWDFVVKDCQSQARAKHPNSTTQNALDVLRSIWRRPPGFWTGVNGNINTRKFFDGFARSNNMDPLVSSNWSSVSVEDVENEGGSSILFHYGGSLIHALKDTYREVEWNETDFRRVSRHYWKERNNRLAFFNAFAKERGFDPLNPENWYQVTYKSVAAEKGGAVLLRLHGHSVAAAIGDLYPDIGLDSSKFMKKSQHYWESPSNVRNFFNRLASEMHFDPLQPGNWYSVTLDDVASKNGTYALQAYGFSLSRALQDAYPDIGIDAKKFAKKQSKFWMDVQNRRSFFTEFAEKMGFDPLNPKNWSSIPLRSLLAEKSSTSVLAKYKGSVTRALHDAFPDIGFRLSPS